MSEELNPFPGEMAIPVGGAHEPMDDSHPTDENLGYVSIKTKGPGKPITIRSDGKVQTLSQFIQANTSRPAVSNEHFQNYFQQGQSDNRLDVHEEGVFDRKTGNTVTLENSPSETVGDTDYNKTTEPEQIAQKVSAKISDQTEQSGNTRAHLDSEFTSQSEVYSIGPNATYDRPAILDSSARRKYRLSQEGTKKNVGAKKKGHGKGGSSLGLVKRPVPYPNWLLLKEILNRQDCYVDFEGRKHLVQVNLVPVENESEITMQQEDDANTEHDSANINNIIGEGSIDRPPDVGYSLGQDHDQTSAVYQVASTQSATNVPYNEGNIYSEACYEASVPGMVSAPNTYGNTCDQPLDLTVAEPLDLSMKEKSTSDVHEEECSFLEQENDDVNSLELSNLNCASGNMQRETNVTEYRTRCPSVASMYERDQGLGDETFDTDLALDQSGNYTEQNSFFDGNLPSLGKLTLDCNNKPDAVLQNSAVQDSAVKQEIAKSLNSQENTQNGQEHILNLVASGKVTVSQLVELHLQNQQRKTANTLQNTSSVSSVNTGANNFQQPMQISVDTSQGDNAETVQDIPTPAMPNLCSLQLANTEGGIFQTKEEQLRSRLKEKIIQKRQTDENA